MGMIRELFSGRQVDLIEDASTALTFADMDAEVLEGANIPPEFYGLASYSSANATLGKVSRKEAMSVPAIKRARDLIAATLGSLPIDMTGPDGQDYPWPLLDQPEADVPRSVTMANTAEDMLFERTAWWRVKEFGWHTYPVRIERLAPGRVAVNDKTGAVYVDGERVTNTRTIIRFEGPSDGLLTAGARAIRTLINLDASAARLSDGTPPLDYFTPAQGMDVDPDEVPEMLDAWAAAKRRRATPYVPGWLEYNVAGWDPQKLQLAEARQHAVLEIARLAGIDPEELGVSTTSRTYANQWDRRKAFLDFTLGMYRQAFEDRFSMGDLTPRGYSVKFNLSAFLRSDDKTRMETYEIGHRIGAVTTPEIRDLEDKPPLTPAELEALKPAPQPLALPPAPEEAPQ